MSRTVATLRDSIETIYLNDEDECDEWDELADTFHDVRFTLENHFKSLRETAKWEGENHIFLENDLVEISRSSYCGLVAVCVREKYDDYQTKNLTGFAKRFAGQVADELKRTYPTLSKVATFSNGEAVYQQNPFNGATILAPIAS